MFVDFGGDADEDSLDAVESGGGGGDCVFGYTEKAEFSAAFQGAGGDLEGVGSEDGGEARSIEAGSGFQGGDEVFQGECGGRKCFGRGVGEQGVREVQGTGAYSVGCVQPARQIGGCGESQGGVGWRESRRCRSGGVMQRGRGQLGSRGGGGR